jgi:hypothetical protein
MAQVLTERRPAGWVPWAALGLFFVMAIVYWLSRDVGPRAQAKLYRPHAQAMLVVPVEGRLWTPVDERQALKIDDSEMVAAGEQVGVTVFTRPADGLGGGGGLGSVEVPYPGNRYYLKLKDDTYVPLEPKDEWAPH